MDGVMGNVMDRVCDGVCDGVCGEVCDGVCDGRRLPQRLSRRLSQAEGVTEVWLFGKDSFKECPLTGSRGSEDETLSVEEGNCILATRLLPPPSVDIWASSTISQWLADVRGHPPNPVSLMKSDNPAPTSIPTPYVPPHRRVHFKDLIVT